MSKLISIINSINLSKKINEINEEFPFIFPVLMVSLTILAMRSVNEKKNITHLYFTFFILALFGFIFIGSSISNYLYIPVAIIVSVALIYGMTQANSNESSDAIYMTNKVLGLVGILIPIVAMSIIYNQYSETFFDTFGKGYTGFFINFIFYIPCLLNDFVAFLKTQFSLTPSITYLLLGFEIILILMFTILPNFISSKIKKNENLLLKEAFLDKPTIVPNIEPAEKQYNSSFSMWIYTNQQPNKQDCNVFRYGTVSDNMRTPQHNLNMRMRDNMTIQEVMSAIKDINPDYNLKQKSRMTLMLELSEIYDAQTEVKPQIKYMSHSDGNDNFQIIYGKGHSHNISLRSQKWNNFVVNYEDTKVDLFVNGNLERSASLDKSLVFSPLDQFVIGDENGIDGAICNVCYYSKPLTSFEIANYYNLLNGLNPPIII